MKKLLIAMALLIGMPAVVNSSDQGSSTVWVCCSDKAVAYHCDSSCSGLGRCQSGRKKMTEAQAKSQGLRRCKKCY